MTAGAVKESWEGTIDYWENHWVVAHLQHTTSTGQLKIVCSSSHLCTLPAKHLLAKATGKCSVATRPRGATQHGHWGTSELSHLMVVPSRPVCLPQYSVSPSPGPLHTLCMASGALNPHIQVLLLTPMALWGLIVHINLSQQKDAWPPCCNSQESGLCLYLLI